MMTSAALPPTAVNLLKLSRARYLRNLASAFNENQEVLQRFVESSNKCADIINDIKIVDQELDKLDA